ncbi:calmodulin-like protein containing EF hand domain [Trypanosoma rangeli]|uniref:Calmodulin-like protein containing EF hand domain n=1 Tax=Trypanosoma rangeli TaxID=5698 RepID=A0A3R7RIS0_TRYRA|nr:calmodulin-like protein containing EF hand domain [Trypanosoma rangeli]RNF03408.1 calmodulin-like protein containing EF hand domain [Trypanosoma rangeli]|eukprot:RNF03408.1 calmodulin-like protein containing EF hand domain [Trypanosoma rangeli]
MVFFIRVAANVRGGNRNIRLRFASHPTLREVASAAEVYFAAATLQPLPSFELDALVLFDEYAFAWVELYSAAQLSTDCQLYAFVKRERGPQMHDGPQQRPRMRQWRIVCGGGEVLPPPAATMACPAPLPACTSPVFAALDERDDRVPNCTGAGGTTDEMDTSRSRCSVFTTGPERTDRSDYLATSTPWCGDRLRSVFNILDAQEKGYLLFVDLKRAVDAQRSVFVNYSAKALLALADQDGDGRVSYKEWVSFAVSHPTVVDTLFDAVALVSRQDRQGKNCEHASQPNMTSVEVCRFSAEAYNRSRAILTHEEARLAADAVRLNALRDAWGKQKQKRTRSKR